jgi:hypothetical protein
MEYHALAESPLESSTRRMNHLFPDLEDSLMVEENQEESPEFENPFLAVSLERHPKSQLCKATLPQNLIVDGYVKFRITDKQNIAPIHYQRANNAPFRYDIPGLPENFGRTFKFDSTDKMLMKFCEWPN